LRGRSAAAAALSMPKVAAVTVRNFSIVNPPLFEPHLSDEAAYAAPVRRPLMTAAISTAAPVKCRSRDRHTIKKGLFPALCDLFSRVCCTNTTFHVNAAPHR